MDAVGSGGDGLEGEPDLFGTDGGGLRLGSGEPGGAGQEVEQAGQALGGAGQKIDRRRQEAWPLQPDLLQAMGEKWLDLGGFQGPSR